MFITNENNKIVDDIYYLRTSKFNNSREFNIIQETKNIDTKQFGKPIDTETFEYQYNKDIESIIDLANVASHTGGDYTLSESRLNHKGGFNAYIKGNSGVNAATMDINGIKGSLIFDLNDNNKIDVKIENLIVQDLFALDDNRDGILNEDDEYFNKLRIVLTDNNSENTMVKLSSVVNFINLEDYVDKDRAKVAKSNGKINGALKYIDPVYTHDKYNSSTVDSMFNQFANEDGWLEFNDDTAEFMANLAYKKEDIDGGQYLQKVNTQGVAYKLDETGEHGVNFYNGRDTFLTSHYSSQNYRSDYSPGFSAYMKSGEKDETSTNNVARASIKGKKNGLEDGVKFTTRDNVNAENLQFVQKDRFDNIYNEYHKLEDTNANQREFRKYEKEFERITNLDFSKENLEKVKTEVDNGNLTDTFKDMDSLTAIKKDGKGGYILKFDTDRTVQVDDLYFNTDDFLKMDDGRRVSILFEEEVLGYDTNEDLVIDKKEMNFENFAYKDSGKLTTLKEAGVKLIKLHKDTEKVQFELAFEGGVSKTIDTLYKVMDLSKQNRVNSTEELNEIINHPYQNRVEDSGETLHLA